jgi:YebC/PmpR family DNA-binding regulatory protein
MSGHSKWATIHRAKESKDAKKGVIFTKLGMSIAIAVKEGGGIGDPDKNFKLRLVVERARQLNMPKENIARAIEKGMGGAGVGDVSEIMYEGFLPGGVGVLVEAVTDNKARTSQQVRNVLEKSGGSMGGAGAVSHMFLAVGAIVVNTEGKNQDEVELAVIDMGATDIDQEEGKLVVYCDRAKIFDLKEQMEKSGFVVESAEAIMKPVMWVEVSDADVKGKVEAGLTLLEDLEDVAHVFTNYQPG